MLKKEQRETKAYVKGRVHKKHTGYRRGHQNEVIVIKLSITRDMGRLIRSDDINSMTAVCIMMCERREGEREEREIERERGR
jgi:hypothetical protein